MTPKQNFWSQDALSWVQRSERLQGFPQVAQQLFGNFSYFEQLFAF